MANDFKDLLNKIKCGEIRPASFTEDDLNKVKSCLPPAQKAEPEEAPASVNFEDSCIPAALKQAESIIKESQKNVGDVNEIAIVKGRLDEIQQNLLVAQAYLAERLRFYLKASSTIDPLTAELLNVKERLSSVETTFNLTLSQQLTNRKLALETEINNKSKDLLDSYESIPGSGSGRTLFTNSIRDTIRVITGKTAPELTNDSLITFRMRFMDLLTATYTDGQVDKTINVKSSRFIGDLTLMSDIGSYLKITAASQTENDVDIKSKLYDGAGGYRGLYKTLREPIKYLYSLDERGLSFSELEVDPLLKENPDLPKSIKEDDKTYFIKNLDKYQKFYETLGETLPPRVKKEREETYPAEIAANLEALKKLARREAAHHIRTGQITKNLVQNAVFNNITYSASDNQLTKTLRIYRESADLVTKRIDQISAEIEKLEAKIKEVSVDPDQIQAKILAIPCFQDKSVNNGSCEDAIKPKRGTDPFGIRTLTGNDAGLPDMTTPCYWKYFAEELTLMGLLPIPDITAPLFRYYPVNCLIPAFPGPIILTLPQKWKVLSVISSPLGTIVPMISVPISFPSPLPIPIPSLFILYLAPDGNKYMLFAPNLPFLVQPNQAKLGFELDSSAHNPLGLTGPHKGLPIKGAFTLPLKVTAEGSKAARLAGLAAELAQGKLPKVKMPNGKDAPGDNGELTVDEFRKSLVSGDEVALLSAETTPEQDFDRLVTKIRTTINKQIDSFDDFATPHLDKVKNEIRSAREKGRDDASKQEDSKVRRISKTVARSIDPVNLETKIRALIDEANGLIDNLTLGEIVYPDDPSKLNPHLSSALTSIVDLVEMAGRGELKTNRDSDLVKKIRRISKKFNPRVHTAKEKFDLENEADFIEFKEVLTKLSNDAVDYLKGKPKPSDTSEARNEAEKNGITDADKEMQDLLVKSLSYTAIALASPPKISVFDPSKPCCETPTKPLVDGVGAEVLAVLSIFASLSAALISGVSREDVKSLLNVDSISSIGVDQIKDFFDEILKTLPPIKIPKSFDAASLIGSLLVPILSAISLPELPIPGKPMLPVQIRIPLDAIIKPLLKLALAALIQAIMRLMADLLKGLDGKGGISGKGVNSSVEFDDVVRELDCGAFGIVTLKRIKSNQVEITLPNGKRVKLPLFPDIPLDILLYFSYMMNTDVIAFLKKLINAALDSILDPISAIVRPILSLVPSGSWSSLSPLDLVNPIAAVIKQIKLAIEDALAKGLKITLLNMDVYPLLIAAALPVMEALEKGLKEVAYITTAVLCSTGGAGVQVARLAHPIFNQDDLPPWERLTRKNPLFAIFLDEILHRSTIMSLGTLIFYTKLPGMYGVTTTPSLFVPPPRI